ncbi:hypothetical protein GCM10022380_60840 [Amycolatopsis tucumanensis]|uniref:Uncharacterized protein n=1 Tax=Amycolatopsis tucumanensis TaxID=401106 RepID=A0ABP7J425_9PSEU
MCCNSIRTTGPAAAVVADAHLGGGEPGVDEGLDSLPPLGPVRLGDLDGGGVDVLHCVLLRYRCNVVDAITFARRPDTAPPPR